MPGINKAIILGNLGRDPEIRSTQGGARVATLNVATSEKWKDRSGNQQEKTEWHRITIWVEQLVNLVEQYVRKGDRIYIEGQIETRKWTDQQGQERYSTEIVLRPFNSKIELLGERRGGGDRHQEDGRYGDAYEDTPHSGGGNGLYQAPAAGRGNGSYPDARSTSRPLSGVGSELDDEIPF